MSTFVSVGNALQPFTRLLDGISRIAARLPHPIIAQHGHTPFRDDACQLVPFLGMEEFIQHIHRADLLIMHAGAGSVIHAIEAGKVPVVMPRRAAFGEHVNDHQVELAQALAKSGKVVVADGPEELARAVEEAMVRQKRAQEMRSSNAGVNPAPPLISIIESVLSDYANHLSSRHI